MKTLSFVVAASVSLAAQSFAANLIVNPGFEDPVTTDGPPFVGFWESFNGGAGATSTNSASMPRSGAMSLEVAIVDVANSFAGAFQDVGSLLEGDEFTFAGWHKSSSDPLNVGVEVRIEWRDSVGNAEISRTPNFTPVPTSTYEMFSLTDSVPAGADTARLVYAIQSFGASGDGRNFVYVDDTSFESTSASVPDSGASVCLLLAGVTGLGLLRKRLRAR